jgi:hypothetical protein
MTSQLSLLELQQENDRLQSELTELRSRSVRETDSRYDSLQQSEAQNHKAPLLSTVAQIANLLLRSQDYITVLPDVVRYWGKKGAIAISYCNPGKYNRSGSM